MSPLTFFQRIVMTDSAFYTELNHEGILAVRGADAAKFLQGQLTCNLNYLTADHSSLGARCTPKGRMTSSFRILAEGDGFLLAMAKDLLDSQLADLKKYAVFSKATLSDDSAQWARFGLGGADAILAELGLELSGDADQVARADGLIAVGLGQGRVELWVPAERAPPPCSTCCRPAWPTPSSTTGCWARCAPGSARCSAPPASCSSRR